MAPLTAFVTLVQLICLFKQEAGSRKSDTQSDFLRWLDHHRHEEIKNLILGTRSVQDDVTRLLLQDNQELLGQIRQANAISATILAEVRAFSSLAQTLAPEQILSDTAKEILVIFYDSDEPSMIHLPGSDTLSLMKAKKGIKVDDGRFLQDDLDTLVSLGLLSMEYLDKWRKYRATRRGAAFVNELKKK